MKGTGSLILALALLVSLCSANVIVREEEAENNENAEGVEENTTETPVAYDFVVRLAYNLEEEKVPEYLIDVIFTRASQLNIESSDIINLFSPNKFTIEKTRELLSYFGTTSEKFFTVVNLEHTLTELGLPFRTFYNTLRTQLALGGKPLRDALVSLGIDSARFSEGLAYGVPDPYEEFKKGTFTQESLENACQLLGITLDDLFATARNIFLDALGNLPVNDFFNQLKNHGVNKQKSLELWNKLQNTLQDVYNVPVFRDLLNQIDLNLKEKLTLGVITGENNLTINRKTYNIWKPEEKLISVLAETFTTHIVLKVEEVVEDEYASVVVLKFSPVSPEEKGLLSSRRIGDDDSELRNCQYITVQEESVVHESIERAIHHKTSIEIARGNVTELILGSPLICNDKVYGLARDLRDDVIILDTYSAASRLSLSYVMIGICFALYLVHF